VKYLFLVIFGTFSWSVFAQSPAPDSLKVWVDAQFDDSTHLVTLQAKLSNISDDIGYYYYQIRVTDQTLRPANSIEKYKGVVLSLPQDTATIFTKTFPFSLEKDFNFYVYLLEEDFMVADTFWNMDNAYSQKKEEILKPKAPQVYISKDNNLESEVYVINETRTPFGREFHRKFLENWKPPQGANGFWITIRETLTPGRFTILSVSLNNKELFQRYLIPKQKDIEDLAYATVDYLTLLLQNGTYDGSLTSDDLFGKLEETTGE
jgi:Curli assembly protein CsgE